MIKTVRPTLLAKIEHCVASKIRPMLQMDGGDIEIVELTPKKILRVRLQGACCGCPCAAMTLQYGVQEVINSEFPKEKIRVETAE